MIKDENKIKSYKNKLTRLLTGAVAVTMAISLAGCAISPFDIIDIGGNDYSISEDYDYGNSDYGNNDYSNDDSYVSPGYNDNNQGTQNSTEENTNGIHSGNINQGSGTSYNAYLYASGSLSEVIGADAFGYGMSAKNDNADRRLEVGNFVPIYIKLNSGNYNDFVRWVDSKDVKYVYADLYDINNAQHYIDQFDSRVNKQEHQHTDLITSIDKIPTVDQVYNVIVANSNSYLSSHKGYYSLGSNYIKLISEILVSMLKDNYADLSKEDLTRIYCMLNDVKAVGIDSTDFSVNELKTPYNARVTDEAVVILDTEMIGEISGNKAMERTIAHEIAHLFQRMCPDHKIVGLTQIGSSQYVENFDNTGEANSLHFQWLYEAAAEQMSMNEYDAKTPLVYKNMVGYLRTLDLITLIRPNYEENSIATSQMSTNPNAIYEVFGAKTDAEKREIAHMLYSICYIQTEREDFATVYNKENGSITGQELNVKLIMKGSIIQTMTKYFYKNLAERVHNGSVTLQDAFYLINAFEACINRHIIYDDSSNYKYNSEAISFYIETQDKFFQMISEDSGIAFDEIVNKFNNYSLIIQTDKGYQRNYLFEWLKESEKDYVGTAITINIDSLTTNIRNLDYIKNSPNK